MVNTDRARGLLRALDDTNRAGERDSIAAIADRRSFQSSSDLRGRVLSSKEPAITVHRLRSTRECRARTIYNSSSTAVCDFFLPPSLALLSMLFFIPPRESDTRETRRRRSPAMH